MFAGLFLKEFRYQLKSAALYLFAAVILLFYMTQFVPPDPNRPIAPLDEMHFIYWKLLGDFQDGKITDKDTYDRMSLISTARPLSEEEEKILKASRLTLSPAQKEAVKSTILLMNPAWNGGREDITRIKFALGEEEYAASLEKLDSALGGFSYYHNSQRTGLVSRENYYGSTPVTEPGEIMKYFYEKLERDIQEGKVLKRTLGFGKNVKLNEEQKRIVWDTLSTMKPLISEAYGTGPAAVYREFGILLDRMDSRLGGGTDYGPLYRESTLFRIKTFQEARDDFERILYKDGFTGAYARYFADYMGIVAGFFPVFLSAFVFSRDRRYRMQELIDSRPVSSLTYLFSKYLAVSAVTFAAFLIPAFHATYIYTRIARFYSYPSDILAFIKIDVAWILPTVLFTNALGMLLSILFGNGIVSVLVQLLVWFSSLDPLVKVYSLFSPIIRFNWIGMDELYSKSFVIITANRVIFTLSSFVFVALAAGIWSWRRRSGVEGISLRKYIQIPAKSNSGT